VSLVAGLGIVLIVGFVVSRSLVKLFLARGTDPVEADAEPWASPRAWAERMRWPDIVGLLTGPEQLRSGGE
jgi:hypothetical protein